MNLKDKMNLAFTVTMADKYYRLGQMGANNGLHAKDCPFKENIFKNVHWVRGYYSIKK